MSGPAVVRIWWAGVSAAATATRAAVLLTAAALLMPSGLHAQDSEPGLTMDAAVAAALQSNRRLASARREAEIASAELMSARGRFDGVLRASLTETQTEEHAFDGSGGVTTDPVSSRQSSYELSLSREMRSGFVLQPRIAMRRADEPIAAPIPYAHASLNLGISMPLVRNRWGEVSRLGVRVAEVGDGASEHVFHGRAALTVREVVDAYWGYRAAQERLEVHRTSEARAGRLLEETRTLVRAHERPAADLSQVEANLASKRISRLRAEQVLRLARQDLGLLTGLDADRSARLPLPADPFPPAPPFAADDAEVERLVRLAGTNRPELAVAALQLRAAELLRNVERASAKPRLDLSLNVGYAGLTGSADLAGMLAPLYRDIPGVNASLRLSYEAAIHNRQARGRTLQRSAMLEQQRIDSEELAARIASQVLLAATALSQSVRVVAEAETAVRLYETAVENEKRKYELGVATLFDVIMAEDNLTGALLARVDSGLDHALSLSSLRFETGTLLRADDAAGSLAASAATAAP